MSTISKSDKKTWENYISNLNNQNINFKFNKTNQIIKTKKTISGKVVFHNKSKPFNNRKFKPEGILDLHGYTLKTAKMVLKKYILNAYERNLRNILVITGKGQNNAGTLKKEVPLWLNDLILSDLLVNYQAASKRFGGVGALMVRVKNKNKFRIT